ncbi:hypothetical protein F8144_43590 [Streptomyces triticiradicis]|uniref:Uncharacterized protein n=1 Tax=Streptomyces triticiradicis TaxID=2651189 RepID=A0A7J5D1E9_9ACTN|nr:hypothetical protein F8144_43590 [Streptomyces triticiradicis]
MIDDYRLYLHHRWMGGCTNAAALTREIQQLGYRGDINTVRGIAVGTGKHLPTSPTPVSFSTPHTSAIPPLPRVIWCA